MIQKLASNFYWRNILVLCIFLSPHVLQSIAINKGIDSHELLSQVYSYTAFYLYFIFHNRILYEKLLVKKRYLLYTITFLFTLFTFREYTSYLFWQLTKAQGDTEYHIRELKQYNAALWVFIYWADVIYIYISLGVYLAFKFFNERTRLLQAENMQREMELRRLSEQLNPHFLFNSLNNIYSHILRQSSDGKELILKLSELMHYILDSNKKRTVPITEELAFIDNYIAFEQERLGARCTLVYSKDVRNANFQLVPLILFNFIENAFKYGTTSICNSLISIDIRVTESLLKLSVSNPVSIPEPAGSTKTGTDNTRRRLELLYGKYQLDIEQSGNTYQVSLELPDIK